MESQIKQIHQQLVSKQVRCTDLVQQKLDLLKKNTNHTVNSLLDSLALNLAAKVDAKIKNGENIGLLEGIPFGIKDVYMLQGTYTTASSNLLKNYKSAYTATAIQKLLDAGASEAFAVVDHQVAHIYLNNKALKANPAMINVIDSILVGVSLNPNHQTIQHRTDRTVS